MIQQQEKNEHTKYKGIHIKHDYIGLGIPTINISFIINYINRVNNDRIEFTSVAGIDH